MRLQDAIGGVWSIEVVVIVGHLLSQNLKMIHATIDDNSSAIVHQESFVVEVVFKSWMLNRADMVRADIEEDPHIKGQAVDSLFKIGLAGDFHDEMGTTIGYSLSHHLKEV